MRDWRETQLRFVRASRVPPFPRVSPPFKAHLFDVARKSWYTTAGTEVMEFT
jgi:hypothetical protein